jgi:ubiquinone/menaquinone biosynthesis C-methylase UbiE
MSKRSHGPYEGILGAARERAEAVARSGPFGDFVEAVRKESPWRFNGVSELERYLHNVDHHLRNFVPKLLGCMDKPVHTVFDFGCGSGSGSIALAMMFPEIRCRGVDISLAEVSIAHARARLYGVEDRCAFEVIGEGQALPAPTDAFDLCICCSVLEYVTNSDARKLCVQEMVRVVAKGGSLFMSVPNRLYPVEIHSRKLGWNYFPRLLRANIVGTSMWQVRRLARPHVLRLYRTPLRELFTPWTNFCLQKVS